jgi:hypothetical protein
MISSALVTIGIEAFKKLLLEVFHQKGLSLINRVDVNLSISSLENDIKNYVKSYLERHGQIKVLSMRNPVRLESIYTDAELLLGFQDSSGLESIEDLHEEYLRVGNLLSLYRDRYERKPAFEFIKENSRVVILGGPGAGKSTLLKKIGIEAWRESIDDSSSKQLLPVFIELKIFSDIADVDIQKQIIREVEICGFKKNSKEIIQSLLDNGRLLVILDGLDELNQEKRFAAIDAIQNFSDQYRQNDFIVSCRAPAYQYKRLENFKDVEIAGFEGKQTREAIYKWFSNDGSMASGFYKKLNDPVNHRVKQLANTPLLLTLICIFYQQTARFPANKSSLYSKAINVLLEEWNMSKGFIQRYESLDTTQKKIFLQTLAYESFGNDEPFMYQRWMCHRVEEILNDMDTNFAMRGDEIIDLIELDNGIIIKQAEGLYSFSHDTIQEFLCARHISNSFSRIKKTIDERLLDERWTGVFIFLSGLGQSEEVIQFIEQKSRSFSDSVPIMQFLSWATKSTIRTSGELPAVLRRIFAVHIGLCLHLYFSVTDRRFQEVLIAIRMCQSLIKEFGGSVPRTLRKDLLEFEKMIAALITLRQNSNAYYASDKSMTGRRPKVRNMRKQVQNVCKQCTIATEILADNKIFRYVKAKKLNIDCQQIGKDTLSMEESSENYLAFCNRISGEWVAALGINSTELDRLNSRYMKDFISHLYCLNVLKQCGESAKHLSKKNWAFVENRMLFSRWVDPDKDVWHTR